MGRRALKKEANAEPQVFVLQGHKYELCYLAPLEERQARRVYDGLCDLVDDLAYRNPGAASSVLDDVEMLYRDGLPNLLAMSVVITARVTASRYMI